ncbi:TetR/AcrR family transcriptional regulator [Agromyces sp. Marseille-Q5079]|uniref:TetR/AcrR family transcriptional regulator n=1 Tax=Agromyces sp. Marseille-Q5079 TaxID=3439059 RepID=UPI003D9C7F4F
MDLEKRHEPATRRRGDELEGAILDAAWEQLLTGYPNFTYDGIARRAQTSKPVLYRRWPTREALLSATLRHRGVRDRLPMPDTGTLREDLLDLLRSANRRPERYFAMLSAQVGGVSDVGGLTPGALRDQFLGGQPSVLRAILDRAVSRGEIDAERMTPRIAAVPFDLFRMQLFLTFEPIPDEDLVSIVDEVFLPLVRPST